MNKFSHMDLRVTNWEQASRFYENVLSALGFTRTFHSEDWKVFAADGELPSVPYFAIMEDAAHVPNESLIGFWAADRAEVDRIAALVERWGGKILDGPRPFPISPTYYSVFFQDPCGNKFEMVHRLD